MIEKTIITALQDAINEGKFKIKKYKFNDIYESVKIGKVDVVKAKELCYVNLSTDVNKQYMTEWHNDIGHFLLQDLKKNKGQNVFELTTKNTKSLILLILSDNIEKFNELELNHIQIGDNRYMIIKTIPLTESYARYNELDNDFIENDDIEERMSNIISEEDIDPSLIETDIESTALF